MSGFRLTLFGPPELVAPDGRVVRLRTRKQLAVLVYLALEGRQRGVPRDRLVDLIWPDTDHRRGRHSLSQALSAIRAVLGLDAIGLGEKVLLLTATVVTDFDRPAEIGGDLGDMPWPLEGLDRAGGVEFEQWVDRVRGRLIRTVRRALTSEIEELRQTGDGSAVHERAVRLYRIDPRNETAVMLLTEQALQGGDVAEGKALLEEFVSRVSSESTDEYPAIRRLLGRLKSGAHDVLVDAARPLTVEANRQRVFVGRQDELRRLGAAWDAAQRGELTSCVVYGPAGIGKTALLRRFATSVASRGDLVLSVTCQHGAKDIPYATLSDLIEALSRDPELSATDPHWLGEASRIAPFLREKYPGIPKPQGDLGEATRLTVAEAFVRMVEAVADSGPTLIMLDDVHNIDPASRDVIHILTRRMRERPVTLLVSMRVAEVNGGKQARHDLTELTESGIGIEVPVLSAADAAKLAQDLTGELVHRPNYRDVVAIVPALTGGHPYFIEVLVAEWRQHGDASLLGLTASRSHAGGEWHPPESIKSVFSRHHRDLSEDARAILEVLAIAGRGMRPGDISSLTGVPVRNVHKALVDGLKRGILVADGDAASFKNEVHRAFVYNSCAASTRMYRHACIAELLMERPTHFESGHHLEASRHYAQAKMLDHAFSCAVKGAQLALAAGAPREAERALRPLLGTDVRGQNRFELSVLLAEALCLRGDFRGALQCLDGANDGCDDEKLEARASILSAECLVRGRLAPRDQLHAAVRHAVEGARRDVAEALIGKALLVAGEFAADYHDLDALQAVEKEAARQVSSRVSAVQVGATLLAWGFCLLIRGNYAEAWRCFKMSADKSAKTSDLGQLIRALNGSGTCAYAMGDLKHAFDDYSKGVRLCERMGDHTYASNLASNLGACLQEFGRFRTADKWYRDALRFNSYVDNNRFETIILINVAACCHVKGEVDRAIHFLRRAAQAAARTGLGSQIAMVLLGDAEVLFSQGRSAEAKKLVLQAEELTQGNVHTAVPDLVQGFDSMALRPLVLLRRLLDGEGEAVLQIDPTRLPGPIPLCGVISLTAVKEAAAKTMGRPITHSPTADQMIAATGFWGTRRRLEVLRILPAE